MASNPALPGGSPPLSPLRHCVLLPTLTFSLFHSILFTSSGLREPATAANHCLDSLKPEYRAWRKASPFTSVVSQYAEWITLDMICLFYFLFWQQPISSWDRRDTRTYWCSCHYYFTDKFECIKSEQGQASTTLQPCCRHIRYCILQNQSCRQIQKTWRKKNIWLK